MDPQPTTTKKKQVAFKEADQLEEVLVIEPEVLHHPKPTSTTHNQIPIPKMLANLSLLSTTLCARARPNPIVNGRVSIKPPNHYHQPAAATEQQPKDEVDAALDVAEKNKDNLFAEATRNGRVDFLLCAYDPDSLRATCIVERIAMQKKLTVASYQGDEDVKRGCFVRRLANESYEDCETVLSALDQGGQQPEQRSPRKRRTIQERLSQRRREKELQWVLGAEMGGKLDMGKRGWGECVACDEQYSLSNTIRASNGSRVDISPRTI